MTAKTDDKHARIVDAVQSDAADLQTRGEPGFIAAVAADPKIRGSLTERERADAARGQLSPEAAHKIAAAAARDQHRRR